MGAILLQAAAPYRILFPCVCYSHKLSLVEKHYTVWDKELLTMKLAFEVWRHHLKGTRHQIEAQMDHRNLEHLKTAQKLKQ